MFHSSIDDRGSTAKKALPSRTLLLIQVLRAVAAIMVVLHHTSVMIRQRLDPAVHVWKSGASGVDIFFVISGLVMMVSSVTLLRMAHGARIFLLRRLERIVPMYWIVTTIKVILLVGLPSLAVNALGSARHVVASYLFLPTYNGNDVHPVLIVGWTLTFEMLFYIVFASAIWWRVRPIRVLVPVLCLVSAGSIFVSPGGAAWQTLLDPIVLEFLYGAALGGALLTGRIPNEIVSWGMLVGGFAILFTTDTGGWLRPIVWGLAATGVVAGALGLERRFGRLAPRWLLEMGDASYSLYLTHGLVLPVIGVVAARVHLIGRWGLAAVLAASVVGSLLAGELSYRIVELRIIRFFRQRRRAAVPAVAMQSGDAQLL